MVIYNAINENVPNNNVVDQNSLPFICIIVFFECRKRFKVNKNYLVTCFYTSISQKYDNVSTYSESKNQI